MSWEYDPKDWSQEYQTRQKELETLRNATRSIVGDENKVLRDHTLFGINVDVTDVETLRLLLAYMLIYKDMK